MTWLDKLNVTRAALQARPEMAMVFSEPGTGTSEQDLHELQDQYPFVSEEYLDFLRVCDGLQLDMCVLFGSGKTPFTSRKQAAKTWSGIIDIGKLIPIGKDASGCCFALNEQGEVWRFENDPPDLANARLLSKSFSDFLENVLMGPRFVDLFDGCWNNRSENEWSKHMKEQGWL